MARKIDFSKPLSEEDTAYVRQREWMIKDAELSGQRVRLFGASEPETATATSDKIDTNQPSPAEVDATNAAEAEDEEETLSYDDLTVKELQDEIAARNEERDEDDQLSNKGKKEDLIRTLVADDEANPSE